MVNTHAHFDHTFGNARFPEARIIGHRRVPAHLNAHERPMLAHWLAAERAPVDEWREVVVTPPDVLVDDAVTMHVGDRRVDLRHLGRGHTDNDLVVHVPDAAAWLVGDLVEESGPPMYGSGSFPLDWPATVAALVDQVGADRAAVVVPGARRARGPRVRRGAAGTAAGGGGPDPVAARRRVVPRPRGGRGRRRVAVPRRPAAAGGGGRLPAAERMTGGGVEASYT